MAALYVLIFECFSSQTASNYTAYIADTVCVFLLASSVEPADCLFRLKKFTHMKVTSTL